METEEQTGAKFYQPMEKISVNFKLKKKAILIKNYYVLIYIYLL